MEYVFVIIFLLSPAILVVGLVKPSLFSKLFKNNLSRRQIALVSILLGIISFVGVGVTADSPAPTPTRAEQATEDIPTQNTTQDYAQTETSEEENANNEVTKTPARASEQLVMVTRVVDGDTIEIEGGKRVRYIGIDTPETGGCYSVEATNKNRELVGGVRVRLEKDVSETDKFGRLLRHVWVDNVLVNELLVREGYAQSSTYPPDVKYQSRFLEAQRLAVSEQKGLWGSVCANIQQEDTSSGQTSAGDCKYACDGQDKDCGDFATHAEAQTFLTVADLLQHSTR